MEKTFDADLEISWMAKLGIIGPETDESEAYMRLYSVYRLPLVRERCYARAKAAGQDLTHAADYEPEVLAALTPQEIEGLRKYVRENPEV
jgi:hypothetical protein